MAGSFTKRCRHLVFFSYIGTRYAGVQRQPLNMSVQSVLEHAFSIVLRIPVAQVRMGISSRTDSGVHALMNSALVDLPLETDPLLGLRPPYESEYLCAAINYMLCELDLEVRLLASRSVSFGFCAREHMKRRTYLYRLAVLKPEYYSGLHSPESAAPVIEQNRSLALHPNFDTLRFQQGCRLLEGEHNMGSFMGTIRTKANSDSLPISSTLRYIHHIGLAPGRPLMDPEIEPLVSKFTYYDVFVISRSFLYRQVRRMVGALTSLAQGKIELADIQWLLDNPDPANLAKYKVSPAPPGGLYLKHVEYDPKDFDDPKPYVEHNWEKYANQLPDKDQ